MLISILIAAVAGTAAFVVRARRQPALAFTVNRAFTVNLQGTGVSSAVRGADPRLLTRATDAPIDVVFPPGRSLS